MSSIFLRHRYNNWRCGLLGLLFTAQAATVYGVQPPVETDPEGAIATEQNIVENEARVSRCQLQIASGQPQAAIDSCSEALDYLAASGQTCILARILMTLGDLEQGRGQMNAALERYLAALDVASEALPKIHTELLNKLADTHMRLQRPAEATDYLKRLLALRESARQGERDRLTRELEAHFELRQAEDKIDLLQLNALLREEKLDSRNLLLAITATALLTALVFVVLMALAYRARSALQHELTLRNHELEAAVDTIRELAAKDPLTGLFNRRAFLEISRHARARCLRENLPMSLTIGDIDQFKELNDTHGHQVGDEVLTEVAKRIEGTLRNTDIVFRWGGEEFLCLHPATDLAIAEKVIERVRKALNATPISTSGGDMPVTMTFGISAIGEDLTAAIQAADAAMYQGKRSGRNRIVTSQPLVNGSPALRSGSLLLGEGGPGAHTEFPEQGGSGAEAGKG